MDTEILKHGKNELEIKLGNPTIAEILRIYLNKQEIDFAAWRKVHPTKPTILKIQSSNISVKKAVSDATLAIKKDLNKISNLLKK